MENILMQYALACLGLLFVSLYTRNTCIGGWLFHWFNHVKKVLTLEATLDQEPTDYRYHNNKQCYS